MSDAAVRRARLLLGEGHAAADGTMLLARLCDALAEARIDLRLCRGELCWTEEGSQHSADLVRRLLGHIEGDPDPSALTEARQNYALNPESPF